MATPALRVLVTAAALLACGTITPQDPYARAAAERGEPVQAVYSDDLADPWNRLFSAMFTRTVQHRKTAEFADAGPFATLGEHDFRLHPVSTRVFERLEDGDRAAAPFYPSFIQLLDRPLAITAGRLGAFAALLSEALADTRPRTAVDRVLMQMDLWAVFDRLTPQDPRIPTVSRSLGPSINDVLPLLARMMATLALTREELAALPDHYGEARKGADLPDLFSPNSGWLEMVWLDTRMHDRDAAFRQAARVFVKPAADAGDPAALLNALRAFGHDMTSRNDDAEGRRRAEAAAAKVDAVALAMQMLAIDAGGDVVATPLFSTVQVRTFAPAAGVAEHEISRRLLRTRSSASVRTSRGADPAYVPSAGNDFSFVSNTFASVREPILGTLDTRCAVCHGKPGPFRHLATFSMKYKGPAPEVRILPQPNQDRAGAAAVQKQAREDSKSLRALMRK